MDAKRVKVEGVVKEEGGDVVVKEEQEATAAVGSQEQNAEDARSVTAELMAGLRRKGGAEGGQDVLVGATAPPQKKEVFLLDACEVLGERGREREGRHAGVLLAAQG